MAKLLSGGTLRQGGSGQYITLSGAQPQLPPTDTTSTGYTLVTDGLLRTSYRQSLGNLEHYQGTIYSNLPDGTIKLTGTGTGFVHVTSSTESTSTVSGAFVVDGGIGVGKSIYTGKDIHVNGLRIGQGPVEGRNNIVITGAATPPINEFNEGQESIAIGYDALTGMITSYKTIAIGRYAAQSGTDLTSVIAIGDSALRNIGIVKNLPVASVTGATQTSPTILSASDHGLTTGTAIIISGVVGMEELNGPTFWVAVPNKDELELYQDNILGNPLDSTTFGLYVSDGTVYKILEQDNNVAIGEEAATNLIDGKDNFFLGYKVARNLTTGSYNFFLGHEVGQNMVSGNGNISIGGDNLVDGVNDQINIGSVFYYNGGGYLQLNADTGVGLGTASTSTEFGAFVVLGGMGVSENAIIKGPVHVVGGVNAVGTNTGDIVVDGGVGIAQDLWVGGNIYGNVDTVQNLAGGAIGSVPYQISTGTTGFVSIGEAGTVLTSDGTTPYWSAAGNLNANTATYAQNIFVNAVVPSVQYPLALVEVIGDNSPVDADATLYYDTNDGSLKANVLTAATSIYSSDGNPEYNNPGPGGGQLLYSPKVTVSNTTPLDPKVGDFWIYPDAAAELQYVKDGTSYLWVQTATI